MADEGDVLSILCIINNKNTCVIANTGILEKEIYSFPTWED